MKSIKRFFMLGVLAAMTAFCLAPGFALANEGGVENPISQDSFNDEGKYEITEAGTYNLTENVTGYIEIGTVTAPLTINLNGHTLTNTNGEHSALYAVVRTSAVVTVDGADEAGNNGTIEQDADKNGAIRLDSSGTTTYKLANLNVKAKSTECLQAYNGKSATLTDVNMSVSGKANSLIYVNLLNTTIESGTYKASDSMDAICEINPQEKNPELLKSLTVNGGSFNKFPTGVTLGTDKTLYKEADGDYKVVATDDELLTKHCWKVTLTDKTQILYSDDTKDIYFKNMSDAEAFAGDKYTPEEINKSIEGAVVTLDPEFCTYDGTPQKPAVKSVVLDGKTLTENQDYTVSYGENISAGTEAGTVILTGKNDYSGDQTVPFEIKKASTTIDVAELGDMTVGDEFKLNPSAFDGAKFTYQSSDSKVASVSEDGTVKALAAGTATITVSTEGDTNHESATKDLKLTVKAAPTPVSTNISAAKVTLSKSSFTYNGKAQKPSVKSVVLNGKTLTNGTDYTASVASGKKVGTYNVTITAKGSYTGKTTSSFVINPKGVTKFKVSKAKKAFKAKWAKNKTERSGVQVKYSTKKSMAKAKTVKAKGAAAKAKTVKKLKKKTKYYVQVRAYKVVNGKTYYSGWSAKKTVKTK